MRKRLHLKVVAHQLVDLIDLTDRDDEIQIEADKRLYVGIDGLTADHTEAYSVVLEQRENFIQEIGFILSNGPSRTRVLSWCVSVRPTQVSFAKRTSGQE